MPRKRSDWVVTVAEYAKLRSEELYRMLVVSVSRCAAPQGIRVVLEHLDAEQAGRRHEVLFLLPLRVGGGVAMEFFSACGMVMGAGQSFAPQRVVGCEVLARFAPGPAGEAWKVVSFAPVPVSGGGAEGKQAAAPADAP